MNKMNRDEDEMNMFLDGPVTNKLDDYSLISCFAASGFDQLF